jgi:hypothetical protein
VGDPTNFVLVFSGPETVGEYIVSNGIPGPLDSSLLDPLTTTSGVFGGAVVALALDVDYSAAGLLAHPAGIPFGDLYLTGYNGTSLAGLDGMTVSQVLMIDELALGGGPNDFSFDDLNLMSQQLATAFSPEVPLTYADNHLTATNPNGDVNPIVTPEPSSLLLWVGLLAVGTLHYWWRRQINHFNLRLSI